MIIGRSEILLDSAFGDVMVIISYDLRKDLPYKIEFNFAKHGNYSYQALTRYRITDIKTKLNEIISTFAT